MPHKRAKRSVREAEKSKKGYNLAPTAASRDDTPRGAARIFNAAKVQAAFRAAGRTSSEDTGERYAERMRLKVAKDKAKAKAESSEASNGKRKAEPVEETSGKKKKASKTELPKIGEHESLGEYNRRIEGLLRGGVAKAIKAAEGVRGQQVQAAKDAKAERIAIAQGKKAAKGDADSDDETDAADAKYNSDGQLKPNRPERTFAELPQRKRLNDIVQAPPQLPRLKAAEKAKKKAGDGNDAWGATGRTPLSAAQKRILDTERERVVNLYREMKAKKEADKEAAKSKSK